MYPSDLTDAQWVKLEPLLKPPRGNRHSGEGPRKYELRRVVDALLYVVKTGCKWWQLCGSGRKTAAAGPETAVNKLHAKG